MLALDARFTLLLVFCGLSTRWISPSASVYAAAISRSSEDPRSPFHGVVDTSDKDPSSPTQRVFSWHAKERVGTTKYQGKRDELLTTRTKRRGHHRRSHKSIIIPNNHGNAYIVSHARRAETPQWRVKEGGSTLQRRDSHGVAGTVGIMSHVYNSTDPRLVAFLMRTDMNGTSVLNASDTNKTQMYMMPVDAPSSSSRDPVASNSGDTREVMLLIPNPEGSPHSCATFNPNPPQPEPMTMQPCNDANSPHSSQTFMYNTTSRVIRPTWFDGQDDGTRNTTTTQAASLPDNSTTTTSANGTQTATSAQATSTTLSSRDDSQKSAQNVTLVFIPAGKVAAADASDPPVDSQNSTSTAMTTTMTQTVTVFASGSMSAMSFASSASTTINSAASASQSAGGLNVELVGDGSSPSSSAPPISVGSGTTIIASSTMSIQSSSAAAPSSSVNAAAIAASIAASASASSSSALASASAASSSVSASASAASAASASTGSMSGSPSSGTFVAAVTQRDAPMMTPVSTDPYQWQFKADSR
ncbi:hypothetical protein BDZ97DRAFT_1847874 [Flammula alnicola]|nr:hypothetical protein BDZ97DRAFT_1847874 [Flammula alnicola]